MYDNEALKVLLHLTKLLVQELSLKIQEMGDISNEEPAPSVSKLQAESTMYNRGRTSPKVKNVFDRAGTPSTSKWAISRSPNKITEPPSLASPPSDPLETLDFFSRRSALDTRLNDLVHRKQNLTSELSKIPSGGGSLRRKNEVEETLDVVDGDIAATRRRMRDLGVL